MLVSAPAGGVPCSGGCPPVGTYYHDPYGDSNPRDLVYSWILPEAATINQIILSNWPFGSSDGLQDTSVDVLILSAFKTSLLIQESWDFTKRRDDRGTVWDVKHTYLQGTRLQIKYEQEQGSNQNNNGFVTAITGTWLRDD